MSRKRPERRREDTALIIQELYKCIDLPHLEQVAKIEELFYLQGTYGKKTMWDELKSQSIAAKGKKEQEAKVNKPCDSQPFSLPEGVSIPENFFLRIDGTYEIQEKTSKEGFTTKKNVRIISTPTLVSATTKNIDTGNVGSKITFWKGGILHHEIVTQETISSSHKIVSLSNRDISINSNNAKDAINYYDAQRAASFHSLPEIKTTSRAGWRRYADSRFFVLGRKVIHPDPAAKLEREYSSNERHVVEAIGTGGDFQRWASAVRSIKHLPTALFSLGVSFAAPLLEPLAIQNFVFHIWNHSTEGKTAVLQLGVSVWGRPTHSGLLFTWRSTSNGIEVRARQCNSIITPCDDNSQALGQKEMTDTIYMLGNGVGKERANKEGGGQPLVTFNTILFSTGEKPVSSSSTLAGQEVRCIEIQDSPFGAKDAETGKLVQNLKAELTKNYGHAGERYIRDLVGRVNNDSALDELRGRQASLRKKRSNGITDPFLLRTVDYFAVIELALQLAQELLPEIGITSAEIEDAVASVFKKQKEHLKKDNNIDAKALTYIWDCILSEPGRFRVTTEPNVPPHDMSRGFVDKEAWGTKISGKPDGVEKDGYAFLPAKLFALLEKGGFNAKASADFFRANGWVWLQGNQLWTFKMDDKTRRGYVFDEETAIAQNVLQADKATEAAANTMEPPIPNDNPF